MKNRYEYTIDSTEDIRTALEEVDREDFYLTYDNSVFRLRGTADASILVDDSLADLYVVACGPAPVWVFGEGKTTVIAERSSVVYAAEGSVVDAYDSATVYAYDRASVDVSMEASVYVSSDGVEVEAWGDAKVYLPSEEVGGSHASVRREGGARIIRGVDATDNLCN